MAILDPAVVSSALVIGLLLWSRKSAGRKIFAGTLFTVVFACYLSELVDGTAWLSNRANIGASIYGLALVVAMCTMPDPVFMPKLPRLNYWKEDERWGLTA